MEIAMKRSGLIVPISRRLIVLALAPTVGACAAPHTTLRQALHMSWFQSVNEDTIRAAASKRFPVGTPLQEVRAALPADADSGLIGLMWPWFVPLILATHLLLFQRLA